MRVVLHTNVLVAAMRSPMGESSRVVEMLRQQRLVGLASTALWLEYEAVLTRPEHRAVSGASSEDVLRALAALATVMEPVEIRFRLRPEANDPDDDLVLEAAVNGRADALVTFETAAFRPAAARHGIQLMTPGALFAKLSA
jgi:putative PIN family toxin of toxin-antitoxin system